MPTPIRRLRLAVPFLLSLAVSAAAQTTEPAPAVPAVPPPAADASATQPATIPTTQPATAPARTFTTTRAATTLTSKVKFNFKDAPIDSILEYLASSFGFIVVKDSDVHVTGRVTVSAPHDVTAEEAIDLLDTVLKTQGGGSGYGVVRTDKVLQVMTRDKIHLTAPVFVGAKAEDIPANDTTRTQVIPLSTVDAVRLKQDLSSMFAPEADVSANAASNTLIITDTSSRIRRLVEIVSAMDNQKVSPSELEVYKLKYANAAAAAKLISDIFGADNASSSGSNNRGGGQGGGRGGPGGGGFGGGAGGFGGFGGFGGQAGARGPGAPGAADTGTTRAGKVTVSSDDRTNTVVVTAPKDILLAIKSIIDQIDSDPTLETTFFVYPLKNANAVNLQGVLNSLFGLSSGGATSSTPNRSVTGFQALGSTTSGGLGGGRTSTSTASTASRTSTTGSTSSSAGRTGSGSTTGTSTAAADLNGLAYVVAEPDTNALLVTVKTSYYRKVYELIQQLDRDVPQVLIKVLVCEVTHTNSSDIGVEYSVLNQRPIPTLSSAGVAGTTLGGTTVGSNFNIQQAITAGIAGGSPGGLIASVVEQNIAASLKFLATTGKLDVLSRPSILASDNQLASIMVGQLVPIITSSNITTEGTVVNSVTYQQVGIILNVTPHINPDGLVILDVAPTISQLSATTVTIQANVAVPVIDQRQAQTRVAIRNGQTIIIGGLMQDQLTSTTDKIPLLGDIPWLGQAFSHTVKSKSKTELLIFITPQVAQVPDLLPAMSADERMGTQLVPNAVGPGIFQEQMQGMSRGAAAKTPNGGFPVIPSIPPPPPDIRGPLNSTLPPLFPNNQQPANPAFTQPAQRVIVPTSPPAQETPNE